MVDRAAQSRILEALTAIFALQGLTSVLRWLSTPGDGAPSVIWMFLLQVAAASNDWLIIATIALLVMLARYSRASSRWLFGIAAALGAVIVARSIGVEVAQMVSVDIYAHRLAVFGIGQAGHAGMLIATVWGLWQLAGSERNSGLLLALAAGVTVVEVAVVVLNLLWLVEMTNIATTIPRDVLELVYVASLAATAALAWFAGRACGGDANEPAPRPWTGAMLMIVAFAAQFGSSIVQAFRLARTQSSSFGQDLGVTTAASGVAGVLGTLMLIVALWLLAGTRDDQASSSFSDAIKSIAAAVALNIYASLILILVAMRTLDDDASRPVTVMTLAGSIAGFAAMVFIFNGFQRLGERFQDSTLADRANVTKSALYVVLVAGVTAAAIIAAAPSAALLAAPPGLVVFAGSLFLVWGIFATVVRALGVLEHADEVDDADEALEADSSW